MSLRFKQSGGELLYDETLTAKTTGTVFEADFSAKPLTSDNYSSFSAWLMGKLEGTNPFTTSVNFIIDQSVANTYYQNGQYVDATGTQTWDSSFPATTGELGDSTIFTGNNQKFYCQLFFGWGNATTDLNVFSRVFQYSNGYNAWKQINGWAILSSASQISYIGIGLSTEGLASGSRFSIIGNKGTEQP